MAGKFFGGDDLVYILSHTQLWYYSDNSILQNLIFLQKWSACFHNLLKLPSNFNNSEILQLQAFFLQFFSFSL